MIHGINYDEIFPPRVHIDTLRMFMAIVAARNLKSHWVDVNNTFTKSELDQRLYFSPLDDVKIKQSRIFQVLQSFYRPKQVGCNWNERCKKELLSIGFTRSEANLCLLVHPIKKLIVLVYMNNIAIATLTRFAVK